MHYGITYVGNKSKVMEQVIGCMPAADTFVDLFGGGGAVTHAAILSNKYQNFKVNDLDGRALRLFRKSLAGDFIGKSPDWVTRDVFLANKRKAPHEQDPEVSLFWSFSSGMESYVVSLADYKLKYGLFMLAYHNDSSALKGLLPDAVWSALPDYSAYPYTQAMSNYCAWFGDCIKSGMLSKDFAPLTKFQPNQGYSNAGELYKSVGFAADNISYTFGSYDEVEFDGDCVVYCDIPYRDTCTAGYEPIDYEKFYQWALDVGKKHPLFISEYNMPEDRFDLFMEMPTRCGLNREAAVERLFVPKGGCI
jgi:hypothetical protein